MKYCGALGLILGLCMMCHAFGQDYLPAPAFAESSAVEKPSLTARLATYFPNIGDSSEVKLASCDADCGEVCLVDGCDSCGDAGCCGRSCCSRGVHVWGEFLYLNPRDADLTFAVPIDGPIAQTPVSNPIPIGPAAVLDPDYSPGFSVGFSVDLAPCSSLGAEFTHFESQTFADTVIDAPNVIRSNVAHPRTASATTDFLSASGNLGVDFDLIDIDYRHIFVNSCSHKMNYLLGVRYARLDQNFDSRFVDSSVEEVFSDIGFDGAGIRFGLEAEKHSCCTGLMIYGKAIASFVAGDFQASYTQRRSTDGIVADTAWQAGRVVSIADLELGTGWVSCNGCVRLTAGYTFSKWFNTVTVDEYIGGVQNNAYVGLGDKMTFDGLVARAELRF